MGAWQAFLDHEHFTALLKKKDAKSCDGFFPVSCTECMMGFFAANFS